MRHTHTLTGMRTAIAAASLFVLVEAAHLAPASDIPIVDVGPRVHASAKP